MANITDIRQSERVMIMLDKERELKYTLDSFGELEDKYGSVDVAFEALENQKVRDVAYFIWVGLTHEDEEITPKQVARLIPIGKMGVMMELITKAISTDMPDNGEEEKNPNL